MMIKKLLLYLFLVIFVQSMYAQEWNDEMNGLDSIYRDAGANANIYVLYNYNDSILYIGGGLNM